MKKTLLAAGFAMAATSATAEATLEPNMDVQIITSDAVGSLEQGWLVPTIFVFILVLAMAGNHYRYPL